MKYKSCLIIFLILIAGTKLSLGQTTVADLVKEWERAKAYTKAYLDAMPENHLLASEGGCSVFQP